MVSKVKEETSFSVEMPHFNRQDSMMDNQGEAITFCWKDLSIKIKGTEARNGFCGIGRREKTDEKYILRNVSGYCKPGQLLAIMGASGAGKSTLLNALTFRNLGGLTVRNSSTSIHFLHIKGLLPRYKKVEVVVINVIAKGYIPNFL